MENNNEQNNQQNDTPLTFDEILKDEEYRKEYESRVDRRVTQALNTAKTKWAEEHSGDANSAKELADVKGQLAVTKQMNAILGKGIQGDTAEFVQFKVGKMEGDFEKNLDDFLKSNPQYLSSQLKPTTTGFNQNISNKGKTSEKEYLDKKYSRNPYYKG